MNKRIFLGILLASLASISINPSAMAVGPESNTPSLVETFSKYHEFAKAYFQTKNARILGSHEYPEGIISVGAKETEPGSGEIQLMAVRFSRDGKVENMIDNLPWGPYNGIPEEAFVTINPDRTINIEVESTTDYIGFYDEIPL